MRRHFHECTCVIVTELQQRALPCSTEDTEGASRREGPALGPQRASILILDLRLQNCAKCRFFKSSVCGILQHQSPKTKNFFSTCVKTSEQNGWNTWDECQLLEEWEGSSGVGIAILHTHRSHRFSCSVVLPARGVVSLLSCGRSGRYAVGSRGLPVQLTNGHRSPTHPRP